VVEYFFGMGQVRSILLRSLEELVDSMVIFPFCSFLFKILA